MSNLYEALEICLQEIEQGADIETVLFRYPELADELRPILEASLSAKSMVAADPSAEVIRRNRARVLQEAAQRREAGAARPSRRIWFASLRRTVVTLAVILVLFVSSTNLVRAASTTLPGDNLYPVKRTWEDVLLLFTFDLQQRAALELEHENKRLHELRQLFSKRRSAEVDFAGLITSQNGNEWVVSGIRVVVSPQTELRDGPILMGSAVRVRGHAQEDGVVLAERVRLLPPDAVLPDVDDDHESDEGGEKGEDEKEDDNSGKGSGDDEPEVEETDKPESDASDESSNDGSEDNNSGSGSSNDSSGLEIENSDADHRNDDGDNSGSRSNADSNDRENDSGGDDDKSDSGGGDDD